jgi:hypothetical protein
VRKQTGLLSRCARPSKVIWDFCFWVILRPVLDKRQGLLFFLRGPSNPQPLEENKTACSPSYALNLVRGVQQSDMTRQTGRC